MKERRHHNNKGSRKCRTGKTARDLAYICNRLGLNYVGGETMMNLKVKTFRSEKHLVKVRKLDCLECGWPADMNGQHLIEAHHIRTGGTSIKCGDDETVPLCGFNARGCHNKADKNPKSYEKYKDEAARIFEELSL